MAKYTKEEILEKFEELITDAYWSEDRDIDRSNCCDRSYYVRRRAENEEKEKENREYLEALRDILYKEQS